MPDLVFSLVATGPAEHPRYVIADTDSRFWTGEGWTDEETEARLFASVNDAALAIQQILLAEHGDKPLRHFVAPVYVDMYSDAELTLDEIREWLSKAARLTIDPELHGNGPAQETLGLCRIEWRHLREIGED